MKHRKKVLAKARIHFAPRTKYLFETGPWIKKSKEITLLAMTIFGATWVFNFDAKGGIKIK